MQPYIKPDIYPLYKKNFDAQMQENIKIVQKDIKRNWLQKKIKNFALKYNFEVEEVEKEILTSKCLAASFAKDPIKQSIHEKTAASFISELPFVYNFENLPTNDEERTLFLRKGVIVKKKDKINAESKSIDFCWQYIFKEKVLNFYASHKYTNEEGGSQNNQFDDVLNFNKSAVECKDKNTYILSIVDGKYYQQKYQKDITFVGNRLEFLQKKTSGERNNTTTSNELLKTIIPVIIDWLDQNFDIEEYKEELQELKHVLKVY